MKKKATCNKKIYKTYKGTRQNEQKQAVKYEDIGIKRQTPNKRGP